MLYGQNDQKRIKDEYESTDIGRSPFRRDYGRLLHSPSFRRLQGKTQLFPGHESDFFRNRLTHSLEVAQVAKGIAEKINATVDKFKKFPLDLDLIEFASLAHDLGHPPFGHNGEKALDQCMKAYGGFEGNAQTLRILSRVEKKVYSKEIDHDDACGISKEGVDLRLGLNLTYRSLAAILKYDNPIPKVRRGASVKLVKGYYPSEKKLVDQIKKYVGDKARSFKTIECQIMDIADDIAYSTYDLEDAMKGGFTHPLALMDSMTDEDFVRKLTKKVKNEIEDVKIEEVFGVVADMLDPDSSPGVMSYYKSSKTLASNSYFRGRLTSDLVGKSIRGISVDVAKDIKFSKLSIERSIRIKIETLKHLNYELTIMSPRLKLVEYRGFEIVTFLFEALSGKSGHLLLPVDVQEMYLRLKSKAEKMRLICDFIAGMTDHYAIEFYDRLKGSGTSFFKPL